MCSHVPGSGHVLKVALVIVTDAADHRTILLRGGCNISPIVAFWRRQWDSVCACFVCVCARPGVFAFGLFATDIFVNAGQVVTGNLAPYFLTVCKPNYTGSECRFNHQFIANSNLCTGSPALVEKARRSFPSKDAALSVYAAVYATLRRGRKGGLCCDHFLESE